ncbi:MAG: amidohydrolase, partial [Sinomicrobium sp.]|nr:amidohydrolase [Sinomicrobium sp.]
MKFFFNADIYTVDPLLPRANAMVIAGNIIKAVGDYDEIRQKYHASEQIDMEGRTVLPGFFDAHAHVWKIGDLLTFNLDLRGVNSIEEIQQRLKRFSARNKDLKWIRARGYNEALLREGRLPTKHDIDEVVRDKPVFLQRTCAHIATVNTKALEVCKLTEKTGIPFGGSVDIGEDGSPNGVLRETALGLVTKHFPEISDGDYEKMILAACNRFIKYGVTSVSDPAVMPDLLQVYRNMDKAGKLPVRIHAFPIVIPDGDDSALPVPDRYESEHLVIRTVKFFADGGLSGKTAAISEPYKNSTSKGIIRLKKDTFFEAALEAQRKGFQIATHAIGDRAIEMVLDVYEALYKEDKKAPKRRIEHLGLPTPAQLK